MVLATFGVGDPQDGAEEENKETARNYINFLLFFNAIIILLCSSIWISYGCANFPYLLFGYSGERKCA
jgi:hypothetical protein